MPKISKNGILNVCELFFLSDIYVNIGIGDSFLKKELQMECQKYFIFVGIPPYSLNMGNYVKIILTL